MPEKSKQQNFWIFIDEEIDDLKAIGNSHRLYETGRGVVLKFTNKYYANRFIELYGNEIYMFIENNS